MKAFILRRRKLGNTSSREIKKFSKNILGVVRNDYDVPKEFADAWCIRWGVTSNVDNKHVLNSAKGIHEVTDKKAFRLKLAEAGLAGKTWGSFKEWFDGKDRNPVIIRPAVHAQGRHCYKGVGVEDVKNICARFNNYYISDYFPKVAEYRVFVLQGRAVWVAKKTPADANAIAWNVAQGGRFDNVLWGDWPLKAVKASISAFNLTSLDFGGVDVMVNANGDCFVLEINSAPSQTSPYRQECVAKAFDHLLEKGDKTRIPVVAAKGGYLKFIHPALTDKAY